MMSTITHDELGGIPRTNINLNPDTMIIKEKEHLIKDIRVFNEDGRALEMFRESRTLLTVDMASGDVSFPDDLTLDEAKRALRQLATTILKLQSEMKEAQLLVVDPRTI
jgi:hypothetical protein